MDDQTTTLAPDEAAVSEVTVTGTAEFGWAGWEDVGHPFITAWAQSDSIDTGGFTNRDAKRYFDVDPTDAVPNHVEVTFDVPPDIGDPAAGEPTRRRPVGG